MGSTKVLLITIALLATGLAGCIGTDAEDLAQQSLDDVTGKFDTSRGWSAPLEPGQYDVLPGIEEVVASFDGTDISMGLFFPDIPGCDWEADELAAECQVPVVLDSGPYYGEATEDVDYRPPLIEWLVPRGYVVAHMAVRGTGQSAGCMEFMSMNEQKDVDAMVTWLAEEPWSNGNVGMMGRSYDGTTPFMAAAMGNPHLKTIVPISGVASVPDLMFKNGTSELRGPIMHNYVYWFNYGIDDTYRSDHWAEQACPETVVATQEALATTITGDASSLYWQDRDFQDRILENYEGSIWIVHGMEDWNVNPSQVVPWTNELQDAGIDMRAWLGVWAHAYPDRMDEHRNVRWDWAQETLEWFDFYLKGEGEQPPLTVEVEDSLFVWREEASYPPRDIVWETHDVETGSMLTGQNTLTWTSEPLEDDLRIAGLPRVHFEATPTAPGSDYVFAELYDVFPDGRSVRVGWGAINLAHHNGGNTDPQTLTPGMGVTAKMEFEPTDALFGEGHRMRLNIHKMGVEDILQSPNPGPVQIGSVMLHLPTVDRPTIVPSYTPPGLQATT